MIESTASVMILFLVMVMFLALILVVFDLRSWHPWGDWHAWRQMQDLRDEIRDLRHQPPAPPAPPQTQVIEHRHVHIIHSLPAAQSHPQAPQKLIAQASRQGAYVTLGKGGWEFHDRSTHTLIAVQANRLLEKK